MAKFHLTSLLGFLLLASCSQPVEIIGEKPSESIYAPAVATVQPKPRAPRPEGGAIDSGITVAEATEISAAEAAAATAKPAPAAERDLGTSIAALGLLERSGVWVKTPLVQSEGPGRVVDPKTGKSANVTLVPLEDESGAGAQMSFAAMDLLGIPITDLVEIRIFAR